MIEKFDRRDAMVCLEELQEISEDFGFNLSRHSIHPNSTTLLAMVDSAIGGKTGRLKIRKLDRPITSQAVFIEQIILNST